MKPLHPEFLPVAPPPRWVAWALALLAVATMALWAAAWLARAEVEQLRRQLAAMNAPRPAPSPPPVAAPAYQESAREMLRERELEWAATLRALESVAMVGVTPTSVDIVVRERAARVEVEFADHGVLLKYLEALNAGLPAPQWHLLSTQAGAAGGMATATLQRRW
jgi:hypothetical protein